MANKAWVMQDFEGGWSTDLKVGIKHSSAYTQGLDFRKSPSQMSVLPQPTREDAKVVNDLIQNELMVANGIIYALGNSGSFYKRTTAGVWSLVGQVDAGYFGMDYRQDLDSVYLCSSKSVSLFNPVSTTPVLTPANYGVSQSTYNNSVNAGFNVNTSQQGSTNTVTLSTSFNENNTQRRYFQTDIEPLNKISVYGAVKGTGNWTLTLHDGLNNTLATATINNANLQAGAWNDFVFSSQVRASVAPAARTYHFHVTSTVADGKITAMTTDDLSTCDMQLWADRLVASTNGMHPMINFLQYECIGNERYLSVWEPLGDPIPSNSEWQRHRLTFPPYYQNCGLAVLNEYLAIALERVPSGTNTNQDGYIAWWDGLSEKANYFTKIPEGSPYGIRESENIVYYYAGGAEYAIAGPTATPIKVRTMPNSQSEFSGVTDQTVVYPYTATVRRGVHLIGYPSTTTNTSINYGVYSWGSVDKNFPRAFGYNYLISTGTQNNTGGNLKLGMVKSFGDLLHTSWQDGTAYGIDVVNNSSTPASTFSWNSLIFDNGYVGKDKQAAYMDLCYSALPAGSTITLKYRINRGSWITDTVAYSSTTLWQNRPGYIRFNISSGNQGRFNEIQLGFDGTCTTAVTSPPTITMISLVFDPLASEVLI